MPQAARREYLPVQEEEVVAALLADSRFAFKDKPDYLRQGVCPQCGKKELWVYKEKPFVVRCSRLNNCGWSDTTRQLYPELFSRYTERFPPTPADPKATANAYMRYNRQFDLEKIGDWYEQERYRIPDSGEYVETVRFYLDEGRTRYWERLIDKVHGEGQRVNFGGKRKLDNSIVKGDWWTPPGQTIETGDEVFLVEGIFHAIAFHLAGYKAAALLMAGNFPEAALQPHLNNSVRWRLALDDDKAGKDHMRKHRSKLLELKERCDVVLAGSGKDWDDLFRLGKLDDAFLREALWRGRMWSAESVMLKAWAFFAWRSRPMMVIDFNNGLYGVTVDDKLNSDLEDHGLRIGDKDAPQIFAAHATVAVISNCHPRFLYCEKNLLTGELAYFFQIDFANHNPRMLIGFSGGAVESPAAFNKALLTGAAGATFDGTAAHMKIIRSNWFRQKTLHVDAVPFVGYDKDKGVYVYQGFAFQKGRELPLNEHGFFLANGDKPVKTSFRGFPVVRGEDKEFNTEWFGDFLKVFRYNGLACLAFFFGSLFAEQIRAELKSFPFLEITGEHGTGKSTIIEFLWKMLGRDDYEGFDPSKATFAARARAFMQVANMPVVLIESDRGSADNKDAKKKMFDFEELKTAYNGRAIRSLGVFNRGNDIEEPPFRGTMVIAQNAEVDGSPALLSRIIQCHFDSKHFTAETKRLAPWFELATVEQMAGFLPRCLRQEEMILARFRKVFPTYLQQYTDAGLVKDQRTVKTHATLMACADAMQLVIPELSTAILEDLRAFIYSRAVDRQGKLNADHPIVQSFWESYELLNVYEDRDTDRHYSRQVVEMERLNHSADDGLIAINLKQFYQRCMENKVETIPTDQLKKYLQGSKRFKYLEQKTVRSKLLNKGIWCWVFKKAEERKT